MLAALTAGQRELRRHGITAWQDALVGPYLGAPDPFRAYLGAVGRGLIDWRVSGALWWNPSRDHRQILELAERRDTARAGGFRVPHLKIMQDGICENQTAAMLEPYAGWLRGQGPQRASARGPARRRAGRRRPRIRRPLSRGGRPSGS